jgi:hypothetical protein
VFEVAVQSTAMGISSIGVQQILPRTGTGWQAPDPASDQNNDTDSKDAASKPDRAPAAPGTGQIVDKMA